MASAIVKASNRLQDAYKQACRDACMAERTGRYKVYHAKLHAWQHTWTHVPDDICMSGTGSLLSM